MSEADIFNVYRWFILLGMLLWLAFFCKKYYAVQVLLALWLALLAWLRLGYQKEEVYCALGDLETKFIVAELVEDPHVFHNGNRKILHLDLKSCSVHETRATAQGKMEVLITAKKKLIKGSLLQVKLVKKSNNFWLAQSLEIVREASKLMLFRENLQQLLYSFFERLPGGNRGLAAALLLGVQDELETSLLNNFRQAGLAHILALSGFHLTLLGFFLALLLRPFFGARLSAILSIVVYLIYLFIVGFKASLVRAVLMYILIVIGSWGLKPARAMHILGCSFILQTLIFPNDLLHVGFQFSYLALASLLSYSKRCQIFLGIFLPEFLAKSLASSFVAILFSSPLALLNFGKIYPIGLLSSLVITPLISFYLFAVIVSLPLFSIHFLQQFLLWLWRQFYFILLDLLDFFASFPPLDRENTVLFTLYCLCWLVFIFLLLKYEIYYFCRSTIQFFYRLTVI